MCLTAPEPGPSCLVGVRAEAAGLCCGLGSPVPLLMGMPEVRAMGNWNLCHPVGIEVSSLSPQPCQLMERARHSLCCSLKSSVC